MPIGPTRYCKIPALKQRALTRRRREFAPGRRRVYFQRDHNAPLDPEEHVRAPMMIFAAMLTVACAKGDEDQTADSAAATTPAAGAASDPDKATGGSGVPAGFVGRVDRASTNIADAKYTKQGDMWEVQTGPHHIMWAPGDTARGNYTATARLQQVEAPAHREGYGIFVGGSNLDQPTQKYSYFIVGGSGEYNISTRDGGNVTRVRDWTASASVPKQDAAGKVDNNLSIRVAGDSVHFMVNNARVATLPKSQFPTDGIAVIRIGHNLHLQVQPVTITR